MIIQEYEGGGWGEPRVQCSPDTNACPETLATWRATTKCSVNRCVAVQLLCVGLIAFPGITGYARALGLVVAAVYGLGHLARAYSVRLELKRMMTVNELTDGPSEVTEVLNGFTWAFTKLHVNVGVGTLASTAAAAFYGYAEPGLATKLVTVALACAAVVILLRAGDVVNIDSERQLLNRGELRG